MMFILVTWFLWFRTNKSGLWSPEGRKPRIGMDELRIDSLFGPGSFILSGESPQCRLRERNLSGSVARFSISVPNRGLFAPAALARFTAG
jgi:hypothetical protein